MDGGRCVCNANIVCKKNSISLSEESQYLIFFRILKDAKGRYEVLHLLKLGMG